LTAELCAALPQIKVRALGCYGTFDPDCSDDAAMFDENHELILVDYKLAHKKAVELWGSQAAVNSEQSRRVDEAIAAYQAARTAAKVTKERVKRPRILRGDLSEDQMVSLHIEREGGINSKYMHSLAMLCLHLSVTYGCMEAFDVQTHSSSSKRT
jgi:hypothetical protein